MKKRILSVLMIALLTASSVSCGSTEETSTTDTDTAVDSTANETEAVYLDELPEMDLDGMNIHFGCNGDNNIKYNIGNEEMVGEIVQDAVFNRNLKVMERLNFTMSSYQSTNGWGDWAKEVSTFVLAGEDLYQVLILNNNASLQSNNSFCFLDLSDNPYIDISKPYWWKDAIMELSTDTKEYRYLLGDMMLWDYFATAITYFNKDIYTDMFGDPNDLYNMALEGKWTLETLARLTEAAYIDLNGDGTPNEGDQYGMRYTMYYSEALMLDYACIYQRIVRDENGAPIVDLDLDSATFVYDTLYNMIHNTPGSGYTNKWDNPVQDASIITTFTNGNVLFDVNTMTQLVSENLRSMEAAYGMIPTPKMNEEQEEYRSFSDPTYCTIPITCQHVPEVSAVIEGLASEAYVSVKDDFYEVALQSKYSPDDISAQCIDIALNTSRCDFAFAYSAPMSYYGHMLCTNVCQNKPLASDYASRQSKAQTSLDTYIQNLQEQTAQ